MHRAYNNDIYDAIKEAYASYAQSGDLNVLIDAYNSTNDN